MNHPRMLSIRNILIKYSLYKRALERLHNNTLSHQNFKNWFNQYQNLKNNSFLSLPVCEHFFGCYFTELYTKVEEIKKLTNYSDTFCTFHYYKLRNYILTNDDLTLKYYNTMVFLLLLSKHELQILGFKTIDIIKPEPPCITID